MLLDLLLIILVLYIHECLEEVVERVTRDLLQRGPSIVKEEVTAKGSGSHFTIGSW